MQGDEILRILIGIVFITALSFIIVIVIDDFTRQDIGTIEVKCIDKKGAIFQDEWCDKDLTCSWLGIASENKCSNMLK